MSKVRTVRLRLCASANSPSAPGLDTTSRRTPSYATAKARNVAAIADVLRAFGAEVPAILRKAGLDPNVFGDLEQVMPYASLGRLMTESVKATGCKSFELRVGAKTKLSSLGLTSLVSLTRRPWATPC